MSASREKKMRAERAAQGYVDPKVIREAEEKAAQKKNKIIYGVIAALFVVVAVVSLVVSSGVLQRNAKAVSVDGVEYSAAELDYYYYNAYNSVVNSQYASLMGLSTSTPLDQQMLSDTAKLVLAVETEGDLTWHEYLLDTAKQMMIEVESLYASAIGAGEDPNDAHVKEEVAAIEELVGQYAAQNGYATKEYLRALYGKNMSLELFRELTAKTHVATHFESDYIASLTYTEEAMESFYADNRADFDVASYESLHFGGTPEVKYDADGNAIAATEEENAEAKKAAADEAKAVLARVQAGEKLADIAKEYEGKANYVDTDTATNVGSALAEWVFDSARTAGESTVIEGDPTATVVIFHSVGRQDYNTVDVRHILVQVDTTALDSTSETYEADKQALWDEAKVEAEQILADWQAGEATEESFGEMAAQLSDDGADHGLYENVYKGQMVENFENWCFDSSRAVGDTGIVETPYGYHVMYFVGENGPYWQTQVSNVMAKQEHDGWLEDIVGEPEVIDLDGIKHVG